MRLFGILPRRNPTLNASADLPEQTIAKRLLAEEQELIIKTTIGDAFEEWKKSVDVDLLEEAIDAKDEKLLLEAVNYDELVVPGIDDKHKETLTGAGTIETAANITVTGEIVFDETTERIEDFLETLFDDRLLNITEQAKKSIIEQYKLGLNTAADSQQLARDIHNNIGLNSRQSEALAKYKINLQEEGLTRRKINELVDARRDQMLSYRSQTIARTETTRAIGFGTQEYGLQLVDNKIFDASEISKQWISVQDNRTSHSCIMRDLMTVLLLEEFPDPSGQFGSVDYPPGHVNCRADVIIVFLNK